MTKTKIIKKRVFFIDKLYHDRANDAHGFKSRHRPGNISYSCINNDFKEQYEKNLGYRSNCSDNSWMRFSRSKYRSNRAGKINQIQEGSTTKQQVYDLLGKPDSATNMAAGDSYWSYDIKTSKPMVGAFADGNNVQSQYLMIIFGRDGTVKKIIGNNSDSALGVNTSGKGYIPGRRRE